MGGNSAARESSVGTFVTANTMRERERERERDNERGTRNDRRADQKRKP